MQKIRNQKEQGNLECGEQQRNQSGIGVQQLCKAHAHEALSRNADGERKLADEIAVGTAAEHDGRCGTQDCTEQQAGRGRLHDDAESGADESQQEHRTNPARDAKHGTDVPRRQGCRFSRRVALDQAGLPELRPQRNGIRAVHERAPLTTCLSHQPPAAESPITIRPISSTAPAASPDLRRWVASQVVTTAMTESTPPARTNTSSIRTRYTT